MLTVICAVVTAFFYYNAVSYNQENIWFMFWACGLMTIFLFGCELAVYLYNRKNVQYDQELRDRIDSVVIGTPIYESWGTSFPTRD